MARRFVAATFSRTSLSEGTDDIMSSWLRYFGRHTTTESSASSHSCKVSTLTSTTSYGLRHGTRWPADIHNPVRRASTVAFTDSSSGSSSLLTTSVSTDGSTQGPKEVAWGAALCLALTALAATLTVVAFALAATQMVVTREGPTEDIDHLDAPRVVRVEKRRAESTTMMLPSSSLPKTIEGKGDVATTFGAPVAASMPTFEDVFAAAKSTLAAIDPQGADKKERSICDGVFYTYCSRAPPQFLYDAVSRTCIEPGLDEVQLCNHSPNRFASKVECARSCVHGFSQADKCFDTPVFAKCGRQDVKIKQWYFTGRTCASWPFWQGRCPTNESRTFATFADCLQRCVTSSSSKASCEPLDTSNVRPCALQELSYPYFADSVGDHVRCLAVATLARHRCLAGTNKFATKAACQRACVHNSEDEAALGLGWY